MIALEIQISHFHPLLVHLPIGTIMLAFVLELYNRLRPKTSGDELIVLALGFTAIVALASLGTGWLMGEEGGFDEELLFLHRWMAVAFTSTTILLFFLKRAKIEWLKKLYLPVFVAALILISITGHFGGNMTHGEDYLFTDTSSKKIAIKDVAQANVHTDIIQPIFDSKCVSCHNQNKIKGGLLLTSPQAISKGGDTGSILDSLNESSPLLAHRIRLPQEDEEHMPPKGKVQLTSDEIALIQWWMANKNCFDCKTKDLETSKSMDKILSSLEEDDSPRALIAKEVEPVPQEWLDNLNSSGISIHPLSKNNPLLIANMFGKKQNLEKDLKVLKEYAENIVELNLANSQFNDTIVKLIAPFKNLTKLQVQNTSLTDKSLDIFKEFKNLESLNLYSTQITDQIFAVAQNIPLLNTLYLWQTNVSDIALEKFQSDFPQIAVQHIPKDAFATTYLSQPTILSETNFFKESLEVRLESIFEESNIFYTLDGSPPDTTSFKYSAPFKITESTTINAITAKQGWDPSEVNSQSFKKSAFDMESTSLNKPPHEKYAAQQGKTLVDLKRGSSNFVDGNWLGYEGSHFTATLMLSKKETISSVSIGALSAPASWIFFPTSFIIRTSEDGKNFKQVKRKVLPIEKANADISISFFDVKIPLTKAKFVQVEIRSPLKNPSWHPNPGGKSWIFVDEIILN